MTYIVTIVATVEHSGRCDDSCGYCRRNQPSPEDFVLLSRCQRLDIVEEDVQVEPV